MKDDSRELVTLPWSDEFNINSICESFPVISGGNLMHWAFLTVLLITSVYLFSFGYRFYRFSAFLIAGLLGTTFCYLLCASENILEPYINAAIAVVCGLLCAVIASLHSKLGFFVTGFCVGSITGAYCVLAVALLASFKALWFGLTVCFVSGIFVALLSVCWQKLFSIANTSFVAGFLVFVIFDYILEQLVLAHYGWMVLIEAESTALCAYSWVSICIWPIILIVGIIIQYAKTARYFDHLEAKKVFDDNEDNDTPKRSINGTLRNGKSITPEGSSTKTSKSTLRQYSGTRYTGDIVPKNLTGNNALPTTMRTAARMRAMAAQNAGTLAAGFPAGMELGPEYQVMGSTVYYGDTYSEYGAAQGRQPVGPMGAGVPGPQRGRRRAPGAKRPGTNDSSLYEDVDEQDQYCAIDYDQIKNYEYGYAQYGPAYMGPQSSSGGLDAQQLVMMQQQQIYRQQQSRTSTLGSMRGVPGEGGMYQRIPNTSPNAYQAPVSMQQQESTTNNPQEGIQMDNLKSGMSNGSMGPGPSSAGAFPPAPGAKSPPLMQRGPTRAPPPPPAATQSFPSNEDYMEPVVSASTSKV
ncbi:uncharacterized protein LOC142355485 isoform X2 [Convolutriloba macropyga]|uniref:uncharacterized protein LOC142355485 isoform X2 n=1 Tax=Convolutriloba macropyga TaxID=536237 RepID=UPI003F5264DA